MCFHAAAEDTAKAYREVADGSARLCSEDKQNKNEKVYEKCGCHLHLFMRWPIVPDNAIITFVLLVS